MQSTSSATTTSQLPNEKIILWFDLFTRELSKFDGPPIYHYEYALMKTEEGVLGCAAMQGSRLHLWSTETGPDGAVAWRQRRVVDLKKLLPSNSFFCVLGFADIAGAFYLTTDDGVITVDLKSGRVKKISIDDSSIVPYISFYTPDQAGTITRPSTLASSSENVEMAQDEYRDLLLSRSNGQVGDEGERGGWEEVRDKENEGDEEKGEQVEKAVQELFTNGSKAIEDKDFVGAVDCQRRILEISMVNFLQSVAAHITTMDVLCYEKRNRIKIQRTISGQIWIWPGKCCMLQGQYPRRVLAALWRSIKSLLLLLKSLWKEKTQTTRSLRASKLWPCWSNC